MKFHRSHWPAGLLLLVVVANGRHSAMGGEPEKGDPGAIITPSELATEADSRAAAKQLAQKERHGQLRLEFWQALEQPDREWTTLLASRNAATEAECDLVQCYTVPRVVDAARDPSLARFVGRPLDVMAAELDMRESLCGPGALFGNMRGGRSFWATPRFPDRYVEIYYAWHFERRYVRTIKVHVPEINDQVSR